MNNVGEGMILILQYSNNMSICCCTSRTPLPACKLLMIRVKCVIIGKWMLRKRVYTVLRLTVNNL